MSSAQDRRKNFKDSKTGSTVGGGRASIKDNVPRYGAGGKTLDISRPSDKSKGEMKEPSIYINS